MNCRWLRNLLPTLVCAQVLLFGSRGRAEDAGTVRYSHLLEQGTNLVRAGSYAEAVDAAKQAIGLAPRRWEAYLMEAMALAHEGDVDGMKAALAQATKLAPVERRPAIAKTAENLARLAQMRYSTDGQIFELTKLDRLPKPLVETPPQCPADMAKYGGWHAVIVDFIVDRNGNVRNAFAIKADNAELARAAVGAVAHWKFQPGAHNGHVVATHLQVPIVFSLK